MQGMKEKMQDMASTVKDKVQKGSANMQGKADQATAQTHREKAREAEAKAELHAKKAEHHETAGMHHGVSHVPLIGPHHHRPVGTGAIDPTYPTTGTHSASEKYL